ncbi:uncharacterized protein LOC117115801 isoform X2 [Anneissia japonica]|uniref:uncharacterized protein LOC117115801 isoform X2 n=1 Tax=Anneissia japonica TaxID=1529436 RepID=UPI001425916A|nr:uncharacterized protein LOC117115801 isoform X2 [Anneissia japonica]
MTGISREHTFFVYDTCINKKEEDDPKDAIVYFHPNTVSIDLQCMLCGQLVGAIGFITNISTSSPTLVRMKQTKFAISYEGVYVIALAGSLELPNETLMNRLGALYRLFSLFHGSITKVQQESLNRDFFICTMKDIWSCYLRFVHRHGNSVMSLFESIPAVNIPKNVGSLFLKASHILQSCRRHHGVLAGCILYKNSVLCNEFPAPLLSSLLIQAPNRGHLPFLAADTDFPLPKGIAILSVYLRPEEFNIICHEESVVIDQQPASTSVIEPLNIDSNLSKNNQQIPKEDGSLDIKLSLKDSGISHPTKASDLEVIRIEQTSHSSGEDDGHVKGKGDTLHMGDSVTGSTVLPECVRFIGLEETSQNDSDILNDRKPAKEGGTLEPVKLNMHDLHDINNFHKLNSGTILNNIKCEPSLPAQKVIKDITATKKIQGVGEETSDLSTLEIKEVELGDVVSGTVNKVLGNVDNKRSFEIHSVCENDSQPTEAYSEGKSSTEIYCNHTAKFRGLQTECSPSTQQNIHILTECRYQNKLEYSNNDLTSQNQVKEVSEYLAPKEYSATGNTTSSSLQTTHQNNQKDVAGLHKAEIDIQTSRHSTDFEAASSEVDIKQPCEPSSDDSVHHVPSVTGKHHYAPSITGEQHHVPSVSGEHFSVPSDAKFDGKGSFEPMKASDELYQLKKCSLYVQAHSEMVLLALMDYKLRDNSHVINKLWKMALPLMGDLEAELNQVVNSPVLVDETKTYRFIQFNQLDQRLRGVNFTEKSLVASSSFSSPLQIMSDQFQRNARISDLTLRTSESVIYGHQNANTRTFFQPTNVTWPIKGIPSPRDLDFCLEQRTRRKLYREHNVSVI